MIDISKVKDERKDINIKSIQANTLYAKNNFKSTGAEDKKEPFLDIGSAVITDSLFAKYMLHHGARVNSRDNSDDFIVMKFDYGIKGVMTPDELRTYYYKNGATVVWEKKDKDGEVVYRSEPILYKMLYRTPGKAKEGDCVFIKEKLYDTALKYLTMNLWDKMPEENANIVAMSAYAPLTTATAIDYITIPMENILIVKDKEVSAMFSALPVRIHNVVHTAPNNKTYTRKECYVDRSADKCEVKNVLWDGMGLCSEELFPDNMDGFIYCRSHFFKSCLFRGDIQQYFKDKYKEKYETATVYDMFGNVFKVKDIKVIITDNSIKWIKFKDLMGKDDKSAYDYYKKYMKKHKEEFAIVKTSHPSKWGGLQRSSYQMNNSLPCTDRNILENIAECSVDYCNDLKLSHEAFIEHLKIDATNRYSINNVLIALDEWNKDFKYTDYFKKKRDDIISKFKNERLKQDGKLLQNGDNLTICGNPMALLIYVVGEDYLNDPCFKVIKNGIQCYTTRFADSESLAAFRSPHNSPNNVLHLVNTYSEEMQKYFPKLGNNVVVVNGIRTDIQYRANGQDYDTDSFYVTNQPDMAKLAEYAYINYPTIINDIPLNGDKVYSKSMESYAQMDNQIASSQTATGESSNIAQLALSYYYDGGGVSEELEDVFIICSVLAQCSIDGAKRIYDVEVNKELARLRELPCMKPIDGKRYPVFYANIQKRKKLKGGKKKKIEDNQVRKFNCPMDILADIIEEKVIDKRKHKELYTDNKPLSVVFKYKPDGNRDRKQIKDIKSIVEEYSAEVDKLDKTDEKYSDKRNREFKKCMDKINRKNIKSSTMAALIDCAFNEKSEIRDRMLVALYDYALNKSDGDEAEIFLKCFKKIVKIGIKPPENP